MAIITVDFDQEEAAKAAAGGNGYQGYPDGKYILQCLSYEQKPAKSADKSPSIQTKFKLVGSFNGQNLEKPVTVHFSLSPRSVPYNLVRALQAMGVPFTVPAPGKIVFDPDHMIGAKAEATLKNKAGERGNLENWDNWAPAGGAPAQQPQQGFAPQSFGPPPQQQFAQPMQQPQAFGPPNGGWAPPQQMPQQQQAVYPQQPQTFQQPMQQPQGYPQQPLQSAPAYTGQPVYQQQPMQQPPTPGNGAPPAWMQPGLAPPGQLPPRGNG